MKPDPPRRVDLSCETSEQLVEWATRLRQRSARAKADARKALDRAKELLAIHQTPNK